MLPLGGEATCARVFTQLSISTLRDVLRHDWSMLLRGTVQVHCLCLESVEAKREVKRTLTDHVPSILCSPWLHRPVLDQPRSSATVVRIDS